MLTHPGVARSWPNSSPAGPGFGIADRPTGISCRRIDRHHPDHQSGTHRSDHPSAHCWPLAHRLAPASLHPWTSVLKDRGVAVIAAGARHWQLNAATSAPAVTGSTTAPIGSLLPAPYHGSTASARRNQTVSLVGVRSKAPVMGGLGSAANTVERKSALHRDLRR